ncbi:hypothetical protein ACFLUJ_02690 [Chloroflexota bacterium]
MSKVFNNNLAQLKDAEIIFFFRVLNQTTYYFLRKLSKRNKLVHMYGEDYLTKVEEHVPVSIVDLTSLIILKSIYGRDIGMIKLPMYPKGAPYILDRFINNKVNKIIGIQERNEMMKDFDLSQFKVFDANNYSVIYFDDSLSESSFIADKNVLRKELTEIFNMLSKYFLEEEIARKYHPLHLKDKAMIKVGNILPDFIPAELLYNDNVKIYLSFFSGSLANIEKGLVVSLVDLVTFNNDRIKEQSKEILIQRSRSEILFPQSLDELERILINIQGRTV